MKYTIEDLSNGKCAVINDGTLEELIEVLERAFPEDNDDPNKYNMFEYYFRDTQILTFTLWCFGDQTDLPTQSVKDFLKPSLEDKIKELKELAKIQGMECDVVLSEKKIKVSPISIDNNPKFDSFITFAISKPIQPSEAHQMSRLIYNYLNENH